MFFIFSVENISFYIKRLNKKWLFTKIKFLCSDHQLKLKKLNLAAK